jgi:MoxR-like ATPase
MIDNHGVAEPLDGISPVTNADEIAKLIALVRTVHMSDEIRRYIIDLVTATRQHPELTLGASPRATLHVVRAARARAALDGRAFVVPDDVQAMAAPVLAHRLLVNPDIVMSSASLAEVTSRIIAEIIARVPIPHHGARPVHRGR